MDSARDVVITGMGVLSPIGIGSAAFWASLIEGRSGVRSLGWFEPSDQPSPLGGQVPEFDPARFVRPRKALKVMSRDIQLAVAAADLACTEAGLAPGTRDPDRFGVIFGSDMIAADLGELVGAYRACTADGRFDFSQWGHRALSDLFPLWMLKYLPNMPACHVGIIHDARGPNNTLTMAEASSLAALAEAYEVIRRSQADVVLAGGASSRIHPMVYVRNASRQMSQRHADPAGACRPFDADRDGMVHGEGAAVFVLESRKHAEARGAGGKILGSILGWSGNFAPPEADGTVQSAAIQRAIRAALAAAGMGPADLGHVNAHGLGTTLDDQREAEAIRETLGDVPVTAPKSYFGNLGAAAGAVELAASILGLGQGVIPPTRNYHRPDPRCPVRVVHGQAQAAARPTMLALNHAASGQAVAMVLAGQAPLT
jgi:3-oxoacyl-[acyl-carrier-protein] synthase II